MVFSNLVFLFIFLPIVLLVYFISPTRLKNLVLLIFSLIFYAWGEPQYIFLMLFSIIINYFFGIAVTSEKKTTRRFWLLISIIINLFILGYYKYYGFFIEIINSIFDLTLTIKTLPLPIGISFFTFQAMSYVIDVYRKNVNAQKNLLDLALYIALFPQLVAGPIVRYSTIEYQINHRIHSVKLFTDGIKQFILGLAKKVIIANQLGVIADNIFQINSNDLSVATAWIGIIAYTLQIYFDFSGYSDMAIGLGKMFGFEFLKNFNYPYIAKNISDFWRRWHISLSSWFRDYVYIPLGGNRKGKLITYRNILIVWTITGFWHGASWTFMAWGFYYGIIISLERAFLGSILQKLWTPIQHLYVLVLIMIGWVFFRANDVSYSLQFISSMFSLNHIPFYDDIALLHLHDSYGLFILAIICSTPILQKIITWKEQKSINIQFILNLISSVFYLALLIFITLFLVNATYNPFIYFRF